MRKLKKINGYLVVRFNEREKREYETLGTYGVIDAELYTGHLEIDRDVFEYEDADSLEAASRPPHGGRGLKFALYDGWAGEYPVAPHTGGVNLHFIQSLTYG